MRNDSPNRLSGQQGNRCFRNSLFFIKRAFSEGLVPLAATQLPVLQKTHNMKKERGMPNRILIMLCVVVTLSCVTGCLNVKQEALTVRGREPVVYQCENGDRIVARYFSLSDGSLQFVKVLLPDGEEYTLPQALSASGARYTDDRILTWWIKGDSARVEMRDQNGEWQTKHKNCQVVSGPK